MFPRIVNSAGESRTLEFWLLSVIYRFLLDIAYRDVVSPNYIYIGFLNRGSTAWAVLSWALLFAFIFLIQTFYLNRKSKLSGEIVFFLFLLSIVPFTSLIRFGLLEPVFILANTVYWLLTLTFVYLLGRSEKHIRLARFRKYSLGDLELKAVAAVSFLIVFYISGRYTHFRFHFSLSNVYDLRSEARNFQMPTILSYLFSWTKVINSILIAYFMQRKQRLWVAVGILAQLLNFGIDGAKTTLLLMVATILVNLLPRLELGRMNKWALRGFTALVFLCLLAYSRLKNIMPVSLFVRRMLYIPIQIGSFYWDFFTSHVPDFFRQSFARHFGFNSPYPPIAYMIGELYEKKVTSANNGLLSDAVTNLGYAGILVMPLFLAFLFRILDRCSEGIDSRIYVTVSIYLAVTMTNSFIFTILLTHGLLVTMLLLAMMKRTSRPRLASTMK